MNRRHIVGRFLATIGELIVSVFEDAAANKTLRVAIALGALGLAVTVAVAYGMWFDWEWKAMIGWKALVDYINPDRDDTAAKRDAVQVYVVIVAGVIASITAAVGLLNLRLTRKNLEQQRELEARRAQGTALQAYYEQIGNLITKDDLRTTPRQELRELARGQTLTVLQELDASRKGHLLTFLHGAGLIEAENPAVALNDAWLPDIDITNANLQGANFQRANLQGAWIRYANLQEAILQEANLEQSDLRGTSLQGANLQGAILQRADLTSADLQDANLQRADLQGAFLWEANLQEAILQRADLSGAGLSAANLSAADLSDARGLTEEQIATADSLEGATMPDGQEYEDWLKHKEGSGKEGENE